MSIVSAGHRDGISLVVAFGVFDGYDPHNEPKASSAGTARRSPREVATAEHPPRLVPGVVWRAQLSTAKEEVVATDDRTPLDLAALGDTIKAGCGSGGEVNCAQA